MCLEPGGGFNKLDHCGIVYIIIGKESCLETVGLLTVVVKSYKREKNLYTIRSTNIMYDI